MLDGAPDGRIYRRFPAAGREQAAAQARLTASHLAGLGLYTVAQRWDEAARVLTVVYAPPAWAPGRARSRRRRTAVALGLLVLLLVSGSVAVRLSPAALPGAAADPRDGSTPGTRSSLPPAERYSGPVPHFEPAECRSDWLFGADAECGDLIVAEDRTRPDGRRISIHVAIQRAWSSRPQPDPVVYLDGGPGFPPLVEGFWSHPFLDDRDLIVFDQRGTGLSQPSLDCPEVVYVFLREEIDALRDCRRRLLQQGIDLTTYNSAASAADLEDLRVALGYETWNLYGVSYGSRLALTAMRDHPAGIRSAILDSVYPLQQDIYAEGPRNAQRAFDKLFGACAVDEACHQSFPLLEERFYEVVERLDRRPRRVGDLLGLGGTHVDGDIFITLLFHRLYLTDYLADLPISLDAFWNDEWDELEYWLWEVIGAGRGAAPTAGLLAISEGFHYSVQCAEELPFAERSLLGQEEPGVRLALTRAFEWQPMIDTCAMWAVPQADARENLPVVSAVPALLLAGTYDPITPPSWAQAAARTLSAGQLFVVPGVGHGVLGTSYCIDDVVLQFLARPSAAVDGGCVRRLSEPQFSLP